MRTWRKVRELARSWQLGRDQANRTRWSRQEHREAEELDRARAGADRFPPMGG